MGPSPTYHSPEGEESEHGLPLSAEPAVGYCSRQPRPSPLWGSRFVGGRAVGPCVGEERSLGMTPLRGNPSPEKTYLPTISSLLQKPLPPQARTARGQHTTSHRVKWVGKGRPHHPVAPPPPKGGTPGSRWHTLKGRGHCTTMPCAAWAASQGSSSNLQESGSNRARMVFRGAPGILNMLRQCLRVRAPPQARGRLYRGHTATQEQLVHPL